ncbi:MAG: glycosyltransferase family 2 protein, partial [Clostridiales bacterium]|nr:glycosyltransferase family 2 protein [Clostridiales bacterium]
MISIIVPVYNAEKWLRRCINSVLTQTYPDIELVLVNDGSTDRSLEICREYEKQDGRVLVIDQKNSGPSM